MTSKLLDPSCWVEQHGDVLYRFALVRLGDSSSAENVVQETFMAALKSRDSFSGRSSERTWLTGIMKHKIFDHFRKISRELPTENIEAVAEMADRAFDNKGHWKVGPQRWRAPDAAVEAADFWKVLEVCIGELPRRLAMAFTLREMDHLESTDACKILDVTPTNLGVMMHRARARLRLCLEQSWFGDESREAR